MDINSDFTLTYEVEQKDVRPEGMRKFLADYTYQAAQAQVQRGELPPKAAEAIKQANDLHGNQNIPPHRFLITVSASGGHLYYKEVDGDHIKQALYDGTYTTSTDQIGSKGRNVQISDGFDLSVMPSLPLPGVGIPNLPLIKIGNVTRDPSNPGMTIMTGASPEENVSSSTAPRFIASTVTGQDTAAGFQARTCVLSHRAGFIDQSWTFASPQKFAGVVIAKNTTMTDYQGYAVDGRPVCSPSYLYTYQLKQAAETPLASDLFAIKPLLKSGDEVQDDRDGKSTAYFYDPALTLDDQAAKALWYDQHQIQQVANGRLRMTSLSGLFVVLSAGLIFAAWSWRRRALR
jgi:hypothetical protein